VLGAACSLAALGDDYAATALAGSLELLPRVAYLAPPALERAIARARSQVDGQPWPPLRHESTDALLERLDRDLLRLIPSAASRSAAG
jgi:hypothetical protein